MRDIIRVDLIRTLILVLVKYKVRRVTSPLLQMRLNRVLKHFSHLEEEKVRDKYYDTRYSKLRRQILSVSYIFKKKRKR